ncbi:MAG: Na+-dependent transporter [Thermoplasmata archaeon]|nr:Na+-dependent transporter [Thermoplasmata archaeon]
MPLINVLCDVKIWVFLGILLALVFGFDNPDASTILMGVLIAQMAVSLDGIQFRKDDFKTYDKQIVGCIIACFGINTLLTLATGLFFIDDSHLWTGWVMLSSVPCAVSVVVSSLVMKGDAKLSVLGLTVIYVCAIALTPLITKVILGSAADPLEILKYIVMFIAIPFALSFVVKRLHLKREVKSVFINLMMLLMVFIGLGSRRDFIFSDVDVVMWLVVACIFRTFVLGIVLVVLMKRMGVKRENGIVYLVMAAWKNSGMSISLTMALFATTMPDAVLPCAVSLVVEAAWFAVMSKLIDRIWPPEPEVPGNGQTPAAA